MNRKAVTPLDFIIIIAVVVLSFGIMLASLFSNSGNKAVITVNERVVAEYNLLNNVKKEIKTQYGVNTVEILGGECFVSFADCRDGICVSRGKISKIGESIVCLPHKLIVEIK